MIIAQTRLREVQVRKHPRYLRTWYQDVARKMVTCKYDARDIVYRSSEEGSTSVLESPTSYR